MPDLPLSSFQRAGVQTCWTLTGAWGGGHVWEHRAQEELGRSRCGPSTPNSYRERVRTPAPHLHGHSHHDRPLPGLSTPAVCTDARECARSMAG